jgi:uncharacterized protein YfaS (alpha-2-macroglobulin family)
MAKIVPVRTWNWVRAGNSWRYDEAVRERVVASGSGQADADSFAVLAADVAWGRYRMAVRVPGAERAEASLSFNAGWGGGDIDRTPERLELVADRETYRAGEVARLRIPATLAGEAMVAIVRKNDPAWFLRKLLWLRKRRWIVISTITLATGRTTVLQGGVHMVILGAFLVIAAVP